MKSALRSSLFALVPSLALLAAPAALAEPSADQKKAEAAERFDRGLSLFDDGDNAGALAEFKRTYELMPNPIVAYNIGLVYAAMGRPVDAVDALEPVVAAGGLSGERAERAKTMLAEQKARIARLTVTTKPDGARIEIDNVEVARTPLTGPLRIASGAHIVGAVAEGFAPARKEVVVAGNSEASVAFELVPTEGKRLANLTVRSRTPGAEVRVDGEVVGKTPLTTSVTLVAGHHAVELRRPGYQPMKKELDVGEAATGELDFELAVDPAALGADGANLVLDATEPGADVTIDGQHRGVYAGPLRLPKGQHHLAVAVGGFLPVERDIDLDGGQTNVVHVELEPTPEKRADYEGSANAHRTWGIIGIAAGAVIGGGGAAVLAMNAGPKSDAKTELDAAVALNESHQGVCDFSHGADPAQCQALLDDAQSKYDSAKNKDLIGFVGIGVGAAVLVTGVIVLVTGDDPSRYDRPASGTLARRPTGPTLALAPGPGQVGTGLRLSF